MYAIIKTGGKQYRIQEGDIITIEKLDAKIGEKVSFDEVLVMGDGNDIKIGTPFLDKSVSGEVVESGKGKKVIIYKYKAKKDYRKKQGHRQPFTQVKITGIGSVAKKATEADKPKATKDTGVSMSMKKDELLAYAREHNIDVNDKSTKQVIVDKINSEMK